VPTVGIAGIDLCWQLELPGSTCAESVPAIVGSDYRRQLTADVHRFFLAADEASKIFSGSLFVPAVELPP
jgi:hypothetical protein